MKSMGSPDYVYTPQTDEHRAKRSEAMKLVIAGRMTDGLGWSGHLWTAQDRELLEFMHEEGMRRDDIGSALKRTTAATRSKLGSVGVKRFRHERPKDEF